jgi:chromosome segregation ATPase
MVVRMSERTVDLIRKDVQSAKNEAKKNILLPVREVEDVLALVDSLQQQVAELKRQLRRSDREWASATNEVVRLQDQLGEKDRTIDMLTEQITAEVSISAKAIAERDLFKGSFEHWNKEAHRVVDENNKLRKVLEVATDALNGILNGEWSETLDDQFLEVFTTRRINPSQIADEALLEINRELEALGE